MLTTPLRLTPTYHSLVWGGRAMEAHRHDLPTGPIGESWDVADHPRGMTVVAEGPLAGTSLRQLMEQQGRHLVGRTWDGSEFPLLVKLLDANARLSVQVHPDDALAKSLKVGTRGKTECWYFLNDGGELFVGLKPGITTTALREALATGRVEECLNRFVAKAGDFFFIPARTVHALGSGCLMYEVQQTCDVTFRVYDWGRVGLDGKPRALHVEESLATIDPGQVCAGPVRSPSVPHPAGGTVRRLVACPYFEVEERWCEHTRDGGDDRMSIIIGLEGQGEIATAQGSLSIGPHQTLVIPASAGAWSATAMESTRGLPGLRLLVAKPPNE